MGTLFDQPPRNYRSVKRSDIEDFLKEVIDISKKLKLDVPIVLEAYKIKEMERRNDLYVANGDTFDEQMSGLGRILEELNDSLSEIVENKND